MGVRALLDGLFGDKLLLLLLLLLLLFAILMEIGPSGSLLVLPIDSEAEKKKRRKIPL